MKLVFPPASWWPARDRVAADGSRIQRLPAAPEHTAQAGAVWALHRRTALTPRQVALSLTALTLVSAAVGALFWSLGAPIVALFSGLQALGLAAAFGSYVVHATDGETLWVEGADLVVERRSGLKSDRRRFALAWLQVGAGPAHLELHGREGRCHIGQRADVRQRAQVLSALRQVERGAGAMEHGPQAGLQERIGR